MDSHFNYLLTAFIISPLKSRHNSEKISSARSMSSILVLFCSAFIAFTISTYAANQDKIILNRGSSHTILSHDGREFVGDHEYKFTASTSTVAPSSSAHFLPSETLCNTAPLFTEKSLYTVPISDTTGTHKHFLRLHSYSSSYNAHNLSDAFFSVNCETYVLLHNFPATTLKLPSLLVEFCIPVRNREQFDVFFTPEENNPKSYAFITAMEVISVPNLLCVKPGILPGPNFQQTPFSIGLHTALQNDVYGTYRSMDPISLFNPNFNSTWVFITIDANFSYLVRLHFSGANQRIFDIYINNQTAEQAFNVTEVASGSNHSSYRDYAIYVPADEFATTDLWVALCHCPHNRTGPQYFNGILNGLEIFKLNESSGNLAGVNPLENEEVVENSAKGPVSRFSSSKHKGHTIETVSGSFSVAVTPCLMVLCCALKRKTKNSKGSHEKPFTAVGCHGKSSTTTTTSAQNTESNASTGSCSYISISVASTSCRCFSFSEIQDATNNFDDSLLLGVGGFGKVYRGEIGDGIRVAVKRANPQSLQGSAEFKNEIDLLSRLRHRHLVYLIGYCDENSEMCLVYEYASNGTLAKHIHGNNSGNIILSWRQRLEICIGAAKGLDYLHSGAFQTVIHRDVKSTNILLDENFSAKVSDFGLSKTVDTFERSHVTTVAKGSYGYMDPQYFYRLILTKKSDVYSFGVLLFEVLCAKPAVMKTQSGKKMNLSDYALEHLRAGAVVEIIDPSLIGDITSDSLLMFAEVGEKCLAVEGDERPSMADVIWYLEFALQLHETSMCKRKTASCVISDQV